MLVKVDIWPAEGLGSAVSSVVGVMPTPVPALAASF